MSARTSKLHVAAALMACLVVPGISRARGEGGLAWTMFSKSDSFRLTLLATDRAAVVHRLHPAELGARAEPSLRSYLRSADRFRAWPVGPTFRARLPELAALACRLGPYASIELTLEERADMDAPVRVSHARASCA